MWLSYNKYITSIYMKLQGAGLWVLVFLNPGLLASLYVEQATWVCGLLFEMRKI